jgi:MinD superfamily P-loop ATPase
MRQLVILSGKGGTGKTTIAAALAHLASQELKIILADADVDAANLELVLNPAREEEHEFRSGQIAVIDAGSCVACGTCESVCRFGAARAPEEPFQYAYRVDPLACEGCAACYYQCPADAIRMDEQQAGLWFRSRTRFGPLFHAHLFAGQENSGKLVTLVKQQGRLLAMDTGVDLLLVDGPPGIGCPVISASAGADMALLVVEPTVSGAHDLDRILGTTDHFGIRSVAAINKADLNPARSEEIAAYCAERGVEVVGEIPYDDVVTQAMVQGQPVTDFTDGPVTEALKRMREQLREKLIGGERA